MRFFFSEKKLEETPTAAAGVVGGEMRFVSGLVLKLLLGRSWSFKP